jgi:N-acetylglutamate synthase-like GNAT family acetyltransferase
MCKGAAATPHGLKRLHKSMAAFVRRQPSNQSFRRVSEQLQNMLLCGLWVLMLARLHGGLAIDSSLSREGEVMIRKSRPEDFDAIYTIINNAALAYKGVIPDDRWHDPYMTRTELQQQIDDGVEFSCYCEDGKVLGVMGIQDKNDLFLIRHAYVLTINRNKGIGTKLLKELKRSSGRPVLIGTWKAATWAISFYLKNGFSLVAEEEKEVLLRKYWSIPERQVETSVVLADGKYEREKDRLLSQVSG